MQARGLILATSRLPMENATPEQSSNDHQDGKRSPTSVFLVLLTVALSIGLTVAWFTLVGYAVLALFEWIAG
jgi:hypothetical protein